MDRREFLKTTFAASAATVALAHGPTVFAARPRDTMIDAHDFTRDALVTLVENPGTTDLAIIAQHLLTELALRLDIEGWATTLTERDGEPLWNHGGPKDRAFGDGGHKIGHTAIAYDPGMEQFIGPRPVVLTHQIGAVWETPSRLTGGRRELYRPMHDDFHNIADMAAEPVRLEQLDPIVADLTRQILTAKVNVFSPGLYLPTMDAEPEGAVAFASRTYGLAIRVIRAVGIDRSLMMRADLLGGTFPRDVVGSGDGIPPATGPSWMS